VPGLNGTIDLDDEVQDEGLAMRRFPARPRVGIGGGRDAATPAWRGIDPGSCCRRDAERFEDVARNVDVVFDAVGGSTLQRSWDVLGPGGRLVTIVSTVQSADDERTRQALFFVEPNRQQLCDIAAMLATGQLRPVVGAVLPFARAPVAYARQPLRKRRPGKTVVTVIPPGEWTGEEMR
jgi:NADPH:quinone reductase-like Zn-dependent oxidoreductase